MVRGYLGRYGSDIGILSGSGEDLHVEPGPEANNPAYLALSPDGTRLYAALEISSGGAVGAFAIDGAGLTPLGVQPAGGTATCHLTVHSGGQHVLAANYGSGSITVLPIEDDGALGERTDLVTHSGSGPNKLRQAGPHAHMVVNEPDSDAVLAVDLGTDAVYRYQLTEGKLRLADVAKLPGGVGPRHLAFHPSGRYAYIAGELDTSATVLDLQTFTIGARISTLPATAAVGSNPSAIRVSADGRFCYVANRGPETIAVLEISADGSEIRFVSMVSCNGVHPRDFILDGDYLYVANQYSNVVTPFRVDPATGIPSASGPALSTPAPACLLLV
jgi:6-phosphogluconolactonase (cycloisomerase 2 family)